MAETILVFIFRGISLIPFGFSMENIKKAHSDANGVTHIEFVIGSGDGTIAGVAPNIALWNEVGEHVGQWKSYKWWDQGRDVVIDVYHDQFNGGNQVASYILLNNIDNDAICISAIYITDSGFNTVFFGDVGYECGQRWRPSCVWLDNDGLNGINAQAMSFHIPDMNNMYTLCKSSPRYSFWGDLQPDSMIPFFEQPLEYVADQCKLRLDRIIDLDMASGSRRRRSGGSVLLSNATAAQNRPVKKKNRKSSPHISRLIVTLHEEHSARQVCESSTYWGPDTVSLHEGLFSDMETKTLFPLCDHSTGIIDPCFDLDTQLMVIGNSMDISGPSQLQGHSEVETRTSSRFVSTTVGSLTIASTWMPSFWPLEKQHFYCRTIYNHTSWW
ncbi:hypothetical protein F5Y16DRAFT_410135 [Xylariaceae sp. FL0255]|nr:hypothetical protein F5Y16DRAFT_410135 [Xylariaceae sp. FL0255]